MAFRSSTVRHRTRGLDKYVETNTGISVARVVPISLSKVTIQTPFPSFIVMSKWRLGFLDF